MMYAETPVFKT